MQHPGERAGPLAQLLVMVYTECVAPGLSRRVLRAMNSCRHRALQLNPSWRMLGQSRPAADEGEATAAAGWSVQLGICPLVQLAASLTWLVNCFNALPRRCMLVCLQEHWQAWAVHMLAVRDPVRDQSRQLDSW